MGHQVNYHALLEDFAEIEAKIRRIEPLVILYDQSPTAAPQVAPALDFKNESGVWLFCYLVREVDMAAVMTKHIPTQGYWLIEDHHSPVIECSGCFFDGNVLRRGRMYYTDGDYDKSGTWAEKPEAFRKWAAAVLRVTKKYLDKLPGGAYIGPAAARWLATSGGKLVA